ncbi:fumarylacetoacetate hydrolase family protein [Hoeflea sp. WL0058]|uniref:Fumarylacetoacetate hydrolase family protein n=1 Tax=Flavimaribacter sediminis TaxID=2865987 RepID=A0AAE3D1W4_9HYPH|nr:fumarylacetoacetate hydrolase family protein [Flavimaribacter sediminis]MBW8640085.1 fumarylacetoacetate hydrolase family protein [Flavimaribacter sediminis]
MTETLFDVPAAPVIPVAGEAAGFPVHRIFCVGRNYAAHAAEMGHEVDREAPFYFTKPASAIVLSGAETPYAPGTEDLHHEVEFVIAIGAPAFRVSVEDAPSAVFGYAVGVDMTRRDLQQQARVKGRPWDFGKAFENSAIISEITRAAEFGEIGPQRIWLKVGEETKQDQKLSDLVWSVPEVVSHLSGYYHLLPGDLIYTGTPSGVGPVQPGDVLTGGVDGLAPIELRIGPPE